MSIVRWSPWQELEGMQKKLDNLSKHAPLHMEKSNWTPVVDVLATDNALIVHAELPGVEKKDINLDVTDGVLTISGERHYEHEMKEENVLRVERYFGSFSRSFSLPANIDGNKAEASLKDGVLEVKLPRKESAKPVSQSIEIK